MKNLTYLHLYIKGNVYSINLINMYFKFSNHGQLNEKFYIYKRKKVPPLGRNLAGITSIK